MGGAGRDEGVAWCASKERDFSEKRLWVGGAVAGQGCGEAGL